MYCTQIVDPEQYLQRAAKHPSSVTLVAGVVPHEGKLGVIYMVPVLNLHYEVNFPGDLTDERWTHVEVRHARDGVAIVRDTLMWRMQQEPKRYRLEVKTR